MKEKNLTCIVCPRGCKLIVTKEDSNYKISGNLCKRGETYGLSEVTHPVRQITSTVKIKGACYPRCPVITDKEIEKEKIFDVMKEINQVVLEAPIKCGDIIIKEVLNTDVNIIASRSMEKLIENKE